MAAKGGHIDFMFLGPPPLLPGRLDPMLPLRSVQTCSLGDPPGLLANERLAFDWKALLLIFMFCTSDALYEEFGERPHVIINNLHRSKLDANRDKPEATFGNQIAGMISAH